MTPNLVPSMAPRAFALIALVVAALGCKTDSSCEENCMCHLKGWCGANWGRCEPTKDAHCEESEVCRILGLCKAEKGKCVAGTDDQCRASTNCKTNGACRVIDGRCK